MWEFMKKKNRYLTYISIVLILFVCFFVFIRIKSSREIFESISTILAIPSFIITVFVLNLLNITPKNLDRYYETRKMKDEETEMIKAKFLNFLNENFGTTKNTIKKFENYVSHKNSGAEINTNLINECKNKYKDLKGYYTSTKECVKNETLNILNTEDNISLMDPTDYTSLKMTTKELEELRSVLNQLSDDFFTTNQLNQEKLDLLIKIFDEEKGLFQKYFRISELTFRRLGGGTDE